MLVTYNILAAPYSTGDCRYKYPNCDDATISWEYRFKLLKDHFACFDADVICLQEVEADLFAKDFTPFFETIGFSGIMQAKRDIGNAIFFNTKKYGNIFFIYNLF